MLALPMPRIRPSPRPSRSALGHAAAGDVHAQQDACSLGCCGKALHDCGNGGRSIDCARMATICASLPEWLTAWGTVIAAAAGIVAFIAAIASACAAKRAAEAAERSATAGEKLVEITRDYTEATRQLVALTQEQAQEQRKYQRARRIVQLDALLAEVKANEAICQQAEPNLVGRPAIQVEAWKAARGILMVAHSPTAESVDRIYARLTAAMEFMRTGSSDDLNLARLTLFSGPADEGRSIVKALNRLSFELHNTIAAIKQGAPGFPLE